MRHHWSYFPPHTGCRYAVKENEPETMAETVVRDRAGREVIER
jgi:hypothetical protein